MSIKRLSGAGLTTPKSNKLWDQTTFQSGMFAIATVRLTSSASTVAFTGIPATYTHLQVRMILRTDRASTLDQIDVRYNGDSTSGNYYVNHQTGGDGTGFGAAAGGSGTRNSFQRIPGANAGTNMYGAMIMDILDYTSTTKNKTTRVLSGTDQNGSGELYISSGLWLPATPSAINSITITPTTGPNFVANSHFALYGIKVAS